MKPLPKFEPGASSEAQKDKESTQIDKELARMDSQQPMVETESRAPRRPRTKIGHDRSRLVRALEALARATGAPFDPPTLADLAGVSDDEYQAICARLIETLAAGISEVSGIGKAAVPTLDAQLANFEIWQKQRPIFYHWPPEAMTALRQACVQLGGDFAEILPCFAMSTQIKLRSGRLLLLNREGRETKS